MTAGWDSKEQSHLPEGSYCVRSLHLIPSLLPLPHQALSPQPAFSKRRANLPVAQCHEHRHENEIYVSFFAVSYDSHMNRSRPHVFT